MDAKQVKVVALKGAGKYCARCPFISRKGNCNFGFKIAADPNGACLVGLVRQASSSTLALVCAIIEQIDLTQDAGVTLAKVQRLREAYWGMVGEVEQENKKGGE
jgi:hypothetical protein